MCGIYFYQGQKEQGQLKLKFNKIRHRGPDNSDTYSFYNCVDNRHENMCSSVINTIIGFHRLSINDLTPVGHQPFEIKDHVLICNGEIYNHLELTKKYKFSNRSFSDCEVILHLYLYHLERLCNPRLAIKNCLSELDGVFAFVIFNSKDGSFVAARDPIGIRPLFVGYNGDAKPSTINESGNFLELLTNSYNKSKQGELVILSEIKGTDIPCIPFKPGTFIYSTYIDSTYINSDQYINNQNPTKEVILFNEYPWYCSSQVELRHSIVPDTSSIKHKEFLTFKELLINAVEKRIENTDREIGCFLSGGLDSTLITIIACGIINKTGRKLNTFSIGFVKDTSNYNLEEECPDAYYAELIAKKLKTKHRRVIYSLSKAIQTIPRIIYHLESFDTTTIRASTAQYLLSKWIAENTDIKVLLSGEGSDELFGGYEYFLNAPDKHTFKEETRRLTKDLYLFDVLRTDRTVSGNGLEIRVPFLDLTLINYYRNNFEDQFILEQYNENKREVCKGLTKITLRIVTESILSTFKFDYEPEWEKIIYRRKEAFSDAVGYSWVDELLKTCKDYIGKYKEKYINPMPRTGEERWFRDIFIEHFGVENQTLIPYFWMPKWQNSTLVDPSARFLEFKLSK